MFLYVEHAYMKDIRGRPHDTWEGAVALGGGGFFWKKKIVQQKW